MTIKEFVDTNWHRGNVVRLKNGKEYLVKGTKGHGRWLLLYSEEYDAKFVADYRIVDCRTSDYEEPEEVYLEKKRKHQEEAAAKREAERQEYLRAKAERKQKNIEAQERAHQEALARKAAKAKKQPEPKKAEEVKPKVESKPVEKPKTVVKAEPVATSEPAPEQPKRKRQRIRISHSEKVQTYSSSPMLHTFKTLTKSQRKSQQIQT